MDRLGYCYSIHLQLSESSSFKRTKVWFATAIAAILGFILIIISHDDNVASNVSATAMFDVFHFIFIIKFVY
jgi:hypothetical protein